MNFKEQYSDDLLRSYIKYDPEKAVPEGFTSKVMSRIQLEKIPVTVKDRLSPVPFVSAIVTALLITAAFLLPESEITGFPGADLLNRINMKLPEIKVQLLPAFKLPPVMWYVLAGVLFLALFDKAVIGSVNRKKSL